MRILSVHNYYQKPGGEDNVFHAETALLEKHGHHMVQYTRHNDELAGVNPLVLGVKTIWNSEVYRQARRVIRKENIQIVHCHNIFPLISPAIYYAARAEGAVVVQSLHNYRLLCPNGLLLRIGHVCEDCIGKALPWRSVLHACYRKSRPASFTVSAMLTIHRHLKTYEQMINLYISSAEFARQKFIQGGIPSHKIRVKPNFLDTDVEPNERGEKYAIFVGRLSPEKGIRTLVTAWKPLSGFISLKIVGDGPLNGEIAEIARQTAGMEFLGWKAGSELQRLLTGALFLVFPSICYENFGLTVIEAYAAGVPVIVSNVGSAAELVREGQTGLLFDPNDSNDLAAKVTWLLAHPNILSQMRNNARREFETKYTAEHNYKILHAIYTEALMEKGSHELSIQ
ncbi:MAG: glycosyltransferase family 4 protein [Syntrophales bacterium]